MAGPFFAPAKVNLTLQITGRREDGFHLLNSFVAFTHVSDVLWMEPADDILLKVEGRFARQVPADENNLVWRAAQMVLRASGAAKGVSIRLIKNLPTSAGLGGGSADAACVLRELPRVLGVKLSESKLYVLAQGLGADVPVCLDSQPRRMSGIGEVLGLPVALPSVPVLLVNPGVELSTPEVFRAYRTHAKPFSNEVAIPSSIENLDALLAVLDDAGNDLTEAAVAICPAVGDVLTALAMQQGAKLARMSGSGATCFAMFADATQAGQAARRLEAAHPDWWVVDTLLAEAATAA